jgi:hypothetical protein
MTFSGWERTRAKRADRTSKARGEHFAAVVEAAMRAQIVRALQLTTIVAFVMRFDLQRIVRTAIATAMRGYFSFGDSHLGTVPRNLSVCCGAACRRRTAPAQPMRAHAEWTDSLAAKARRIADLTRVATTKRRIRQLVSQAPHR